MARRRDLAQRRRARGMSQETFADSVGVDRTTVARWESGTTAPQPWQRSRIADVLDVSLDDLDTLLITLEDGVVDDRGDDERLRHTLQNPSTVDLTATGDLRARLQHLDAQYDHVPTTSLLGAAGQLHGQVSYLRANAGNGVVRHRLLAIEADSATFMGQLVWDVSRRRDHREPVAYLKQAINAAREFGDPVREAYAVLRSSYIALYGEKDPTKGAVLADRAAKTAQAASPALTGLALLHVAEGRAMTGDAPGCESALLEAEALLNSAATDDTAAEHYTVHEWTRLAGSCYLALGQHERAEPILRATVHALSAKRKSQAIAMGNLALALIRQHKLDEAAAAMHRTIDAVEHTMGGGGLVLAFNAGQELREWRHETWAQEIQDRLMGLIATT
ncbi:helix-turn-helix domain-containing protein [Jiangella alkaliphila]|nr:helix-turn-helix transcriptional regulator [Jiangella alkaliphila]